MAPNAHPRYFVARPGSAEQGCAPDDDLEPTHVIDTFLLGGQHGPYSEWVVGTDLLGNLRAIPESRWNELPASVRAELVYHEVSGGQKRRRLDVEQLFLFNIELLEQPADAAGWNDAVYLYGTLYGPYPNVGGAAGRGIEGQLTVTRCDVLDGLVWGAHFAFHLADPSGAAECDVSCLHVLLPGDTDEATRLGRGLVLAYPLLPAEVTTADVSNEAVVGRLLYDLLVALKDDLAREGVDHPLRSIVLPVPSRFIFEQELIANGYQIKGDTAVKAAEPGHGVRGFLASALGSLLDEEVPLPPEGGLGEFLAIARNALSTLPGWPSPRASALHACVAQVLSGQGAAPPVAPPRAPAIPAPSANPLPVRTPTPIRVRETGDPPVWMRDFIAAHRGTGAPPPRLTSTQRAAPSGGRHEDTPRGSSDPDWMRDFERPSTDARPKAPKAADRPGDPDWMKDFE